jgi:hypothetical protein
MNRYSLYYVRSVDIFAFYVRMLKVILAHIKGENVYWC